MDLFFHLQAHLLICNPIELYLVAKFYYNKMADLIYIPGLNFENLRYSLLQFLSNFLKQVLLYYVILM